MLFMIRERIRGIIFDFDGTLIDSFAFHLRWWREAFSRFGIEIDSDIILRNFGKSHEDMAYSIRPDIGLERAREIASLEKHLFRESEGDMRLFPEVLQVLNHLTNIGVTLSIASSNPRVDTERMLEKSGIREFFSSISGADEVNQGKPHPDLIFLAAERASIKSDEALLVGDTQHDIVAGRRAGLKTMLVIRGEDQSIQSDEKADYIVSDLKVLLEMIKMG